jgi:serine phosphatase RsbU (regulator of sigma subunit)
VKIKDNRTPEDGKFGNRTRIFRKICREYEFSSCQYILLTEQGNILASNNSFLSLSEHIGELIGNFISFLEIVEGIAMSLTSEAPQCHFPRMENPVGDREGIFDYTIKKIFLKNETLVLCVIYDNTQYGEYLFEVQAQRNKAMIAKEITDLKMENAVLAEEVAQRTNEIIHQKQLIEDKNRKITESMIYAKNIQKAILPDSTHLNTDYFSSFVFYRPKDIISGDFYWATQKEDKYWIAVADCTGHGVPGAMMTMVGNIYLGQVLEKNSHLTPAKVLSQLDKQVGLLLKSSRSESQAEDGMDIALFSIDTKTKNIEYAAGGLFLYLIRNKELQELRGDRFGINDERWSDGETRVFQNKNFQYEAGDVLYLSSDGYSDQFGGEFDRKFTRARFKEFLLSIHQMPLEAQREEIETQFKTWKGKYEQIDDILVMGMKF